MAVQHQACQGRWCDVNSDLCVTPHDPDRRALPTLRLCGSCRDHLERLLAEMPALYADLGRALATTGSGGQRVSGTAAEPLPINPAVAEHRHQIQHDLVWWVVYVAQTRGIALPARSEPAVTAAWLTTHVEWLAADRAAAEECLPVMRALAGRARGLLDPDRRLHTGERCRVVAEEGERCEGTIAMVLGADDGWRARCSHCGTQEAAAYLHDKLAGRLVTIERVEAYVLHHHGVRVARATIRSWAAREHVQTSEQNGATWYDLGSVERYLSERGRMAG
jgi:hypothetical protein